ncbi:unnamed protein product [Rotaria sp. Silwood1]|nr:unnamed protein product [Rotaria sp. Silwood1]
MNQHDAVMPMKIYQFFSDVKITQNTFPILNSLSISHIDHNLWKSIKDHIRQIKSLISISIYLSTTLPYNPACQLTVDILRDLLYWSSTLKNVYLEADDRLVDISRFNLRQEQISSIEHLTLRYITIDIKHLYLIVPDLRSFDAKIASFHHIEDTYLYSFQNLQQLSIHVNRFHMLTIEQLLYPMIKLNQLVITGNQMYNDVCDGLAWERILTNIISFKFMFSFEENHDLIQLDSFRSSFWLEQNHWYVQYDYSKIGKFSLLYSIPYFMNTYPWLRMKGSIVFESTGQQPIVFSNVNRLIVDYQRPINNELRNRFTNIEELILDDNEKSFDMLINDIVPYIDMLFINSFTINQCFSEFDEDNFVQFIMSIPHLCSVTIPIDLLRLSLNNCWQKIKRLKILPRRQIWSARFMEKGLTSNEVDMLCSSFRSMEQISFHVDIMPYLVEFLTKMPKTLSTIVIEHLINATNVGLQTQKGTIYGRQTQSSIEYLGQDEQCLYLNIFTPINVSNQSLLPVLIWIHGDALQTGCSSQGIPTIYNGTNIIANSLQPAIIVTINYRLGVLADLYLPALVEENSPE